VEYSARDPECKATTAIKKYCMKKILTKLEAMGRALVRAKHSYPKGSPNTNS
jgi:hypothetical protein